MTPKEKAEELVTKILNLIEGSDTIAQEMAKDCALIAVDEILNDYSYMQNVRNANSNQIHSRRVYWQEVKQEITNI